MFVYGLTSLHISCLFQCVFVQYITIVYRLTTLHISCLFQCVFVQYITNSYLHVNFMVLCCFTSMSGQQFSLAGSREERFGGLLHGFSREILATAWGVDEDTIRLLLDSQKGATMIKTGHKFSLTDPRFRARR